MRRVKPRCVLNISCLFLRISFLEFVPAIKQFFPILPELQGTEVTEKRGVPCEGDRAGGQQRMRPLVPLVDGTRVECVGNSKPGEGPCGEARLGSGSAWDGSPGSTLHCTSTHRLRRAALVPALDSAWDQARLQWRVDRRPSGPFAPPTTPAAAREIDNGQGDTHGPSGARLHRDALRHDGAAARMRSPFLGSGSHP